MATRSPEACPVSGANSDTAATWMAMQMTVACLACGMVRTTTTAAALPVTSVSMLPLHSSHNTSYEASPLCCTKKNCFSTTKRYHTSHLVLCSWCGSGSIHCRSLCRLLASLPVLVQLECLLSVRFTHKGALPAFWTEAHSWERRLEGEWSCHQDVEAAHK
eukprot:GHRR01001098.1.p1 GENE.GHRR01001098.1~~GHRR01001098.1.p1  ORF type:complete len:161 (-),score=30.39 GHRR01001098.1:251-733(-)